ncbi:hypothetical protein ABS71_10705 [bacterium SCN 62-11]|nr:serine/threonine protein kinase [Candidatus Eremiobacteraeota bacterium]ODT67519.1 MAG: hypothetical protein ABS71_10705 [bacterium SCN 62-11]
MKRAVLWLLLVLAAGAEPHSVTFRVWPPGTRVTMANSARSEGFLGLSGVPVPLDEATIPAGTITLSFEYPGYKKESRDVKGRLLLGSAVWPPEDQPEVRLLAGSSTVAARDFAREHPVFLAVFVLLGVGLAGAEWMRRTSHGRALRLARLAEDEAIQKAATLEASLDPSLAVSLNGYRILRELGKGGMAIVYEVERAGEATPLALKLLHREISENPDALKRVRREVRVWRELIHPGIVPLLDFGEINGRYYFVMDKITGDTLQRRLRQGRVRPAEAIRFMDAMLDAVAYAHGRGVIHRDIKPDNIMLREDGRLQVLDFGISRSVDQQTMITLGDSVLGTPAYMAPERFSGQNDFASDQYALGLIFYELFTGVYPMGEDQDIGVLLGKQFNYTPPRMSAVDARIPVELDNLVMRMLEKDPVQRFPSVEEARQALHGALGKKGRAVLV